MANAVVEEASRRGLSHEERHARVEYLVAHGIASSVDGEQVRIGSAHFIFEDEKCVIPEGGTGQVRRPAPEFSQLYLAIEGGALRRDLHLRSPAGGGEGGSLRPAGNLGVKNAVMLTGDSPRTAAAIAGATGGGRLPGRSAPGGQGGLCAALRRRGTPS